MTDRLEPSQFSAPATCSETAQAIHPTELPGGHASVAAAVAKSPIPTHILLDDAINAQHEVITQLRILCQRITAPETLNNLEKESQPPREQATLRRVLCDGPDQLLVIRDEQLKLITELNILLFNGD